MGSIRSDSKKQAVNILKQAAKHAALEPVEILKTAGEQVVGMEEPPPNPSTPQQKSGEGTNSVSQADIEADKVRSRKLIADLESELANLKKEKGEKEAQEKMRAEREQKREEEERQRIKNMQLEQAKPHKKIIRGVGAYIGNLRKKSEIRLPPSG